jgi:trimeric autotransporter adhesin
MGFGAVERNTTGTQNTGIGSSALYLNTTGYCNTALGYNAGGGLTTGFYNTYLVIQQVQILQLDKIILL